MGIVYIVVNETKKQFIDPGKVGGGATKSGFCLNVGSMVVHMMTLDWRGDRYYDIHTDPAYEDVTLESLQDFNESWPDDMIATCDDGVPSLVARARQFARQRILRDSSQNGAKVLGAIAFLRDAFRRDGAEGESVHLVCDTLEHLLKRPR
jgi:hypothetical protein